MNKAKIIGRKIVGISQERTQDSGGDTVWDVKAIYLDNGTVLILNVVELGHDYAIKISVQREKVQEE